MYLTNGAENEVKVKFILKGFEKIESFLYEVSIAQL